MAAKTAEQKKEEVAVKEAASKEVAAAKEAATNATRDTEDTDIEVVVIEKYNDLELKRILEVNYNFKVNAERADLLLSRRLVRIK